MKGLSVWLAITLAAALSIPTALARKPRPLVQVYGVSSGASSAAPTAVFYTAFLIFLDGSHALAMCSESLLTPCAIESAAIEKRVKVPCDLVKEEDARVYHPACYQSEWYESERKGNDITLRTARGRVTYHIHRSW